MDSATAIEDNGSERGYIKDMPKEEVRLDKWLWAMRVFKTRTISTDACRKGRISVGAEDAPAAKPSRTIKIGDIIYVRKPPVTHTFRVKGLAENRLGARLVPEYLENLTPQSQYDLLDIIAVSGFVDRRKGLGRPTKREGRELRDFREQAFDGDWFLGFDDDNDDDNA